MGKIDQHYPDWIDSKFKEAHVALLAQVEDYNKNISNSVAQNSLKGLRQYTGRGISSLHAAGYMSDVDVNAQLGMSPAQAKVNFNLTASVIDTLTAKLASIDTIPQSVTFKGNPKGRNLARDLNFILKGLFHKKNLSHMINLIYRDAMINRAGYLKVVVEDGDVIIDRVMVDEIIVDPADGYYNNPYKMIHRKAIPLHVALAKWPKFAKDIEGCQIQEVRQYNTRNYTPCINVIEAWCKNSYVGSGRHVIAIETKTIIDEDWDKDYFPILRCSYSEPVIGWLGQSVVDELDPIQKEIDRILITMQAILKLISIPRVFVDTNSQVNKNHITNKLGVIIEYDGKSGVAPIIHNGASMPPELPAQLEFLISQGYARVGLTSMDTQGQKQAGLDSGEALKTMNDIKSERWQLLQKNYERTHVELANLILKELQGTNIKIPALDKKIGLVEISTKRIPKTDDSYILKVFPISALPDSIPDKIDAVEKLMKLGVIPASHVPDLFQMPDLDSYLTMQSAPRQLIEERIADMLEEGTYFNPEPYHDLDFALSHALQQYSFGQLHHEPDSKLKLLRSFINDVRNLLSQRIQPVAQQPVQPQGANNGGTSNSAGVPGQPTSGQ